MRWQAGVVMGIKDTVMGIVVWSVLESVRESVRESVLLDVAQRVNRDTVVFLVIAIVKDGIEAGI